MFWENPTLGEMNDYRNGVFAVRTSDNIMFTEDWSIDVITIDSGVVMTQVNVYTKMYKLPDMRGWTLLKLWEWLNMNTTGDYPENYNEITAIQAFTK